MRKTFSQSNHHRNPKKITTFDFVEDRMRLNKVQINLALYSPFTTFVFNKRSVTYLRKYPITQYIVSDSGHSTKELKRSGTTRICKAMKYNDLHLSPHSVYLSKQRLYRLKCKALDYQACEDSASESEWRKKRLKKMLEKSRKVNKTLKIRV